MRWLFVPVLAVLFIAPIAVRGQEKPDQVAINKRKLVRKTAAAARKCLFG